MAGKRLKDIYKKVDKRKVYTLKEAVDTIKNCAKAKFDETIEISMNLNIDPKNLIKI